MSIFKKEKMVFTTSINLNWRSHHPDNFRFAQIYSKRWATGPPASYAYS